jgi:hypothetical protein
MPLLRTVIQERRGPQLNACLAGTARLLALHGLLFTIGLAQKL